MCPELPWIGASPDRLLIGKDGSIFPLEIKCPEKCINTKIEPELVDYLERDDAGKWSVSERFRGPGIMLQVQLQIFLSKSTKGYLFVYSPHNDVQLEIDLDKTLI